MTTVLREMATVRMEGTMWDYLILTAANAGQAAAYREQLDLRRRLGLLSGFRHVLVVSDAEGKRVGSGGSTLACLAEIRRRQAASAGQPEKADAEEGGGEEVAVRDRRHLAPRDEIGVDLVDGEGGAGGISRSEMSTVRIAGGRGEGAEAGHLAERDVYGDDVYGDDVYGDDVYGDDVYGDDVYGEEERWARVRALIIHAGGDSRRLPAYGPCGKIFLPLPLPSDSALPCTLFDYQLPIYASLPYPDGARGQFVITSGDVLLDFDPTRARLAASGLAGLACRAAPEQATRHGVYCLDGEQRVRRVLQKPSLAEQQEQGAIDRCGESILDVGVIQFDAETAVQLLELAGDRGQGAGDRGQGAGDRGQEAGDRGQETGDRRQGTGDRGQETGEPETVAEAIAEYGLDFYREFCCALGTESSLKDYLSAVRAAGSRWPELLLTKIYAAVSRIPASVCVLPKCEFLHFGSTREIRASGRRLLARQQSLDAADGCLSINNDVAAEVPLPRSDSWVEGCRLRQGVRLPGQNVLVGVDSAAELDLPPGTCLDVLPGRDRRGATVHFVRCYHEGDPLHNAPADHGVLCGQPLNCWFRRAGLDGDGIWDGRLAPGERSAWNARLFPAESQADGYRRWLWMLAPASATPQQFRAWAAADRYSLEEMLLLADRARFHARRSAARDAEIRRSLHKYFRLPSGFSAADLAYLLEHTSSAGDWCAVLVREARWQWEHADGSDPERAFGFGRVLHTSATALQTLTGRVPALRDFGQLNGAGGGLEASELEWLVERDLEITPDTPLDQWCLRAHARALEHLRGQIIRRRPPLIPLRNALRPDEIVWGRAPARLDLAGGWTDTPPYSLEHGGCVINAAVLLNGQPPIQAYARVTPARCITLRSIDVGSSLAIDSWDQLLDYRQATSEFGLVKAALAISGFAPRADTTATASETLQQTLDQFGGGLELTTVAAIPKGSGLGTSSIMGAVLLAVIHRVLGRELAPTELFHSVLRLEQTLTTGGGWQDQIGGVLGGLKLITTEPGMIPQATTRYFPADVLDPQANGGQTLLYYTGITRLAKNILEQVVGRYLDRDRRSVATLEALGGLARGTAESVARKDYLGFGRAVARAWQLNKRLDPNSSNEEVEALQRRIRPHVHGAKLLGAGGGGFLLMVCKSREDADAVRRMLEDEPPNDRARFFDFAVSNTGLEVSVC